MPSPLRDAGAAPWPATALLGDIHFYLDHHGDGHAVVSGLQREAVALILSPGWTAEWHGGAAAWAAVKARQPFTVDLEAGRG